MQTIALESDSTPRNPPQRTIMSTTLLKPQRACDFCRRRKTKCDGPTKSDHACSNCIATKQRCTYVESSKPRGPPKSYVTKLEDHVEEAERFIKRLQPQLELDKLVGPRVPRGSWKSDYKPPTPSTSTQSLTDISSKRCSNYPNVPIRPGIGDLADSKSQPLSTQAQAGTTDTESEYESDDSDDSDSDERRPRLYGESALPYRIRYSGKSSTVSLLQDTFAMKKEKQRSIKLHAPPRSQLPPYERQAHLELEPLVPLKFPPPDLCNNLIELYFIHINPHFPLFHRPTFQAQYNSSLHYRSRAFGGCLLTLFAVASRWSDDQRVLDKPDQPLTAGWKFFKEQSKYRPSSLAPPCLFDIQRITLISYFLRWTSHASVAWVMNAIGLRLAQDVGAHRRRTYQSIPNVEDELWKRAFWILVLYDRISSASLGRPCVVREEDFDLDLPLEVDDEYWLLDDPRRAFKQPPGKPCLITYFIFFLKIAQMMAYTIRTIYCIDKTKVLLGLVGPVWREQVIKQLDTAMNEWLDSVPSWLKWEPNMPAEWSMQSATLYTSYYLLVLLIYRPFIPPPNVKRINGVPQPPGAYPFPALSMCVRAAHSAIRIIHAQIDKGEFNKPSFIAVSHLSGAIILMNIWEMKRRGPNVDVEADIADVHTCLKALEICKERWENASMFEGFLRAGLPDKATVQSGPRPPSPINQAEKPHDRAMQPPQLTDGIHWFSQVDIASQYQPSSYFVQTNPQSSVGAKSFVRLSDLPSSSEAEKPITYPVTSYAHSYPQSNYRMQMAPQVPAWSETHQSTGPYLTTVTGQLPWWAEAAVDGRPAYGAPSGELSTYF